MSIYIWTVFGALIGLSMYLIVEFTDDICFDETTWSNNHLIRFFYGISSVLGVIFVLGMVGYLTFTVHWWYIFVAIGGFLLARFVANMITIFLKPIYDKSLDYYGVLFRTNRIIGSIIIWLSVIIFFIFK